ncbi:hypothetical protein TanjilG_15578 [Lupinus angustifolius]|uniref:E3 ubiquitin-protein ligase ATL6 n=1 Tax=Lupinus angustifolius TaxID=3871 RepID=UPI00090E0DFE|nr:PREDICTED: E3 ubiquitin-protein ligase ATL6 [Lupinus angustifolius]OIV90845.1 hypothetical protein TanjilG_15578 [Lupinus angustifolius]
MKNINHSSYESGSRTIILCFLFLLFTPLNLAQTQTQTTTNNQNDNYYNRFSPSLAIIIVVLVAALFLMGFFSIYVRNCADSPSSSVRNNGNGGRSRRGNRGLDPSVIETFPTLEYSAVKMHKIGKGALECAVCLCEFEDAETLRLIPVCDHVFHPECIDEWLASHTTCPVCRANLALQPGELVQGIPITIGEPGDIEAQNELVQTAPEQQAEEKNEHPEVVLLNPTLNRNRIRGSRSSRKNRFPRSHSTGHSLIQPGENTERFTLRLPVEVREKILQNPELHRARSMVMLPREGSTRQGYRTGAGEGSSRGRYSRRLDRGFKSDRWVFTMAPPFLVRASSIRSPRVTNNATAVNSAALPPLPPLPQPAAVGSARFPV